MIDFIFISSRSFWSSMWRRARFLACIGTSSPSYSHSSSPHSIPSLSSSAVSSPFNSGSFAVKPLREYNAASIPRKSTDRSEMWDEDALVFLHGHIDAPFGVIYKPPNLAVQADWPLDSVEARLKRQVGWGWEGVHERKSSASILSSLLQGCTSGCILVLCCNG